MGPYAVAGAVSATLARLGDGPVRLARAVAVLDGAPLITAARLAGIDPERAAVFGAQLVRAGILRDVRPLEFEHALVRDAVVSGLTAGARAELHAHAARILGEAGAAPETVAVHLLHADPRGDEAVADDAGRRRGGAHSPRAHWTRPPRAWHARSPSLLRLRSARRCCWTSHEPRAGSGAPRRSIVCSRRPTPPSMRSTGPRRRSR